MVRKLSLGVVIFFSAMLLNFSSMALQQRYDRRERETGDDPFVIELTDHHALKFLKNVYFWDLPVEKATDDPEMYLYVDNRGAGVRYHYGFNTFMSSHLKFVLISYMGFFPSALPPGTFLFPG